MKLTRQRLFDFRNYETLDLTLDPGVNLILGENAQGKTNLLEAVGYLSTGRSFRTQKTQELIRFGASFAAAALLGRCEAEKRSSFARRSDDGAVLSGRPSGFKRRQPAAQEAA